MIIELQGPIVDAPLKRTANAVVYSGFILAGAATIILGPILPILIARWSLTDEEAGLLFTLQFCGNLLGVAALGTLISRYGYRRTFGIAFALIALGLFNLNSGVEVISVTSTAVFGCGLGLLLPGANLWVAEVAESRRASALSILNLAWGIGAISCPVLIMLAQRNNRLSLLFSSIAGLSVLFALACVITDLEPRAPRPAVDLPLPDELPVGLKTGVALCGLFFLYCGAESAVGGWTAALTRRMGTNQENLWELTPMFFWAGLLTGRALGPLILRHVPERIVLIVSLIIVSACNGAILWVANLQAAAICLVVAGLGIACVYPLLVSTMVGYYGRRARRAGSIIFAFASLGAATIPWLVGFTSTHLGGLRVGLLVPLVACAVMLCLLRCLEKRSIPDIVAPTI
jgi:FHS family glucose/mannose:H+ symporter-like MFS transporter